MVSMSNSLDERILILAPIGRDASLAQSALRAAGLSGQTCADMEEICSALERGAGGLVVTQEALSIAATERLRDQLDGAPAWSDLPLVVLASNGSLPPTVERLTSILGQRANVTVLERPAALATLLNAVQVGLRARRRQYEIRELLIARAEAEAAERASRILSEEAVRTRDEFLASVAHDLKNPLGAIKGYAQLLQRRAAKFDGPEVAKLMQGLSQIDTMTTRLVSQVDELLDLAHLQANQMLPLSLAPTDLVDLVRRVVAEYQQVARDQPIEVKAPPTDVTGIWDHARLERVVGNLLSNAIKYSPGGESIIITITVEEDGEPIAVLSIRDHGIGISSGDLPHIFERFYRAENVGPKMGSGLGLAGARHIVEQHGGSISAKSAEGRGSIFTVRLPVIQSHSVQR